MTEQELREQVTQLDARTQLAREYCDRCDPPMYCNELEGHYCADAYHDADRIIALVRKARQAMPGMGPGLHHYPSELPLPERAVKGVQG